jgi:hypothetical protein
MDGKILLREGGQDNAAFIIMPKELLVDTIHLHVEDAHGQRVIQRCIYNEIFFIRTIISLPVRMTGWKMAEPYQVF